MMYITKIKKWGNSQGIVIPRAILDIANISETSKLIISVDNDRIIVKQNNRKSLRERFKGYTGNYIHIE